MRASNDDKLPVDRDVPEIVIVADEYAELPLKVQQNLESISNTGRAAGVRVLNCALRGTADIVSSNVKKQAQLRIGMRVSDADELAFLFGWNGRTPSPEDAPYEGCGFLMLGQDTPRPFKGYRLRPNQIEDIAIAVADSRPSLDAASASAAGTCLLHPLGPHRRPARPHQLHHIRARCALPRQDGVGIG